MMMPKLSDLFPILRDLALITSVLVLCAEVRRVSEGLHEHMVHTTYDLARTRDRLASVDRSLVHTARKLSGQ